jgi:Rad3-related DNA helicase
LAGYLDADGHLDHGGFEFTSELKGLAEGIEYVARSLGFSAYVKPCRKKDQHGTEGTYFRGTISGETWAIPTKIRRKMASPRGQIKSVLRTGIKVDPIGVGAYFGFSVDGDHLFLLGDFTVVHNSGLAWTIASHAAEQPSPGPEYQPGAYILTTQKALQEQYMRDFAELGMRDLRGASNYHCYDFNTDCQTGTLLRQNLKKAQGGKKGKGDEDFIDHCLRCEYRSAKQAFMASMVGTTNFAYFLAESKHIHMLKPRAVLIIDEAHNTETQLLGQVEIEITRQRCEHLGAPRPPAVADGAVQEARAWTLDHFLPCVESNLISLEDELERADASMRQPLSRQIANLRQYISRIGGIKDGTQLQDWFCNTDSKTGTLKLRPLTAAAFAQDALFKMGHKVLFLSATILDAGAFGRGLGLNPAEGGFCRVPSDFPVENRPVHFYPVGSMSYKNKEATTPKLCRFIERILLRHAEEKGIIHAQSYALAKQIKDYLDGTEVGKRILMPEPGYGQRKEHLEYHHSSDLPTVLLSPSMTEGLDLYGDLSRFQILPKVPYPSLGDPFIKARMERDESWYGWQTALSLVQASGRSIRSREDSATTYILDSDFSNFLSRSGGILPNWWKDALVYH